MIRSKQVAATGAIRDARGERQAKAGERPAITTGGCTQHLIGGFSDSFIKLVLG